MIKRSLKEIKTQIQFKGEKCSVSTIIQIETKLLPIFPQSFFIFIYIYLISYSNKNIIIISFYSGVT